MVSNSLGLAIPVWLLGIVSNGLLLLGAYFIARSLLPQAGGNAVFLSSALIYWSATTIGLELLSPFGGIAPVPILFWAIVWLVMGGCIRWRLSGNERGRVTSRSDPGITVEAVVSLALVAAAALILGMRSLLLAVKVVSDGPIYHLYFAVRWWKAGRLVSCGGTVRRERGDLFSR